MTQTDLIELIQRARAGDPQAQEELIADIQNRVYYHCKKMLKNESDAQDAAQDVLITVLTSLDKLREPAAFYGWVNGITANRCKHLLSQGKDAQFLENEDGSTIADDLEDLDVQAVPEAVLDDHETQRLMMEIIDALPPDQRMSVLFYYYDEMSVRDIAQAMEVSEGTVKSRLNYARKSIKAGVEDLEKRGTKLYGLAPLPLLLFLLRREAAAFTLGADQSAQLTAGVLSAAQAQMAAAGASGAGAAGTSAASGAAGTAAVKTGLTLGAKILLGLAAAALAGGAVFAGAKLLSPPEEPPAAADRPSSAIQLEEDEPTPTETPEPEPEGPSEELLALLDSIVYYGDPQQCTLTPEQAAAFAETIRQEAERFNARADEFESGNHFGRWAAHYAALFDVGDGTPALFFAGGMVNGDTEDNGDPYWDNFSDDSIWEYRDGQMVEFMPTPSDMAHLKSLIRQDGGLFIQYDQGKYALTESTIPTTPATTCIYEQVNVDGSWVTRIQIDGADATTDDYSRWYAEGETLCAINFGGGGVAGYLTGFGDAAAIADALEQYAAGDGAQDAPAPSQGLNLSDLLDLFDLGNGPSSSAPYAAAYAQVVREPWNSEKGQYAIQWGGATPEDFRFDLIYIDDDDIPELAVYFPFHVTEGAPTVDLYSLTPEGEAYLVGNVFPGKYVHGMFYYPRGNAIREETMDIRNSMPIDVTNYYWIDTSGELVRQEDRPSGAVGDGVELTATLTAEEMLAQLGQ